MALSDWPGLVQHRVYTNADSANITVNLPAALLGSNVTILATQAGLVSVVLASGDSIVSGFGGETISSGDQAPHLRSGGHSGAVLRLVPVRNNGDPDGGLWLAETENWT